jgi:hypothetical protein
MGGLETGGERKGKHTMQSQVIKQRNRQHLVITHQTATGQSLGRSSFGLATAGTEEIRAGGRKPFGKMPRAIVTEEQLGPLEAENAHQKVQNILAGPGKVGLGSIGNAHHIANNGTAIMAHGTLL